MTGPGYTFTPPLRGQRSDSKTSLKQKLSNLLRFEILLFILFVFSGVQPKIFLIKQSPHVSDVNLII